MVAIKIIVNKLFYKSYDDPLKKKKKTESYDGTFKKKKIVEALKQIP